MWDPKYREQLKESREAAHLGGGYEALGKQKAKGKGTARERVEMLFDEGTFTEIDTEMQAFDMEVTLPVKHYPGDGVIIGYGEVEGRPVFTAIEDFTVNGGTLGEVHADKICHAMDMAFDMKVPFVMVNDSGGARIQEGLRSLNGYSKMFLRIVRNSGVIPQIAVVMGPCAGGACYAPALCDFIFMMRKTSQMFITGPGVVKSTIGEDISVEELGGADVHMGKSGVAHFAYDDEAECLDNVRRLLGYLPSSNVSESTDVSVSFCEPPEGKPLEDIVPDDCRRVYDMKRVIEGIFDGGSFMEVHSEFARNVIVGFARLAGRVVGIVANQPSVMAGGLDIDSSDKISRFIRLCDTFNIPLVTLEDVPAFWPGSAQEHGGIIRHGAKILYAYCEATVPKITVIIRKAYGGAYIAMNSKGEGADMVFAWPIAEMAVIGAESAIDIIYKRDLASADDPVGMRKRLLKEYQETLMGPHVAAVNGLVDKIILPEETRDSLIAAFRMMADKNTMRWEKKHGNIPL